MNNSKATDKTKAGENRSLAVKLREWAILAPLDVYEFACLNALMYHTKYRKDPGVDPLVVWPSIDTVAALAGCSVRKAQDTLKALRDNGYITALKRLTHGGYVHRINLGHYHAQKKRLPKADMHDVPICTQVEEVTSAHHADLLQHSVPNYNGTACASTSAHGAYEQVEQEQVETEQEGVKGEKTPLLATAKPKTKKTGKTKSKTKSITKNPPKKGKVWRVLELAEEHGYELTEDPGLDGFYEGLGEEADEMLRAAFGDWNEFKVFAVAEHGSWIWKHKKYPNRKPVTSDLLLPSNNVPTALKAFWAKHKDEIQACQAAVAEAERHAKYCEFYRAVAAKWDGEMAEVVWEPHEGVYNPNGEYSRGVARKAFLQKAFREEFGIDVPFLIADHTGTCVYDSEGYDPYKALRTMKGSPYYDASNPYGIQ